MTRAEPLTLERAIYLKTAQAAVLAVLQRLGRVRIPRTPHEARARVLWRRAPVEMTRLHAALPLAADRTFSLLGLLDYFVSEAAGRA